MQDCAFISEALTVLYFKLGDLFDILPFVGGDKPRHYKQSFTGRPERDL